MKKLFSLLLAALMLVICISAVGCGTVKYDNLNGKWNLATHLNNPTLKEWKDNSGQEHYFSATGLEAEGDGYTWEFNKESNSITYGLDGNVTTVVYGNTSIAKAKSGSEYYIKTKKYPMITWSTVDHAPGGNAFIVGDNVMWMQSMNNADGSAGKIKSAILRKADVDIVDFYSGIVAYDTDTVFKVGSLDSLLGNYNITLSSYPIDEAKNAWSLQKNGEEITMSHLGFNYRLEKAYMTITGSWCLALDFVGTANGQTATLYVYETSSDHITFVTKLGGNGNDMVFLVEKTA
ncbi:MAG: hypothetical protein E7585_07010 [Ruminococcaceae bacterium]|nr:hypothetical protein [Oscillospiraceae bacterium]